MTNLLSIIYVSSALQSFEDNELKQLLVSARKFNKANRITGVLLYAEGNFMQCIEGPHESVLVAFDRVQKSRRHKGLIELNRTSIEHRSFESWEMGLARPTNEDFISISNALLLASKEDSSSAITIEFIKTFVSTIRAV